MYPLSSIDTFLLSFYNGYAFELKSTALYEEIPLLIPQKNSISFFFACKHLFRGHSGHYLGAFLCLRTPRTKEKALLKESHRNSPRLTRAPTPPKIHERWGDFEKVLIITKYENSKPCWC